MNIENNMEEEILTVKISISKLLDSKERIEDLLMAVINACNDLFFCVEKAELEGQVLFDRLNGFTGRDDND
ncbi:MAG: hypothetical protein ACI4LO_00240 [Anaerovoracaceae bacterium]